MDFRPHLLGAGPYAPLQRSTHRVVDGGAVGDGGSVETRSGNGLRAPISTTAAVTPPPVIRRRLIQRKMD